MFGGGGEEVLSGWIFFLVPYLNEGGFFFFFLSSPSRGTFFLKISKQISPGDKCNFFLPPDGGGGIFFILMARVIFFLKLSTPPGNLMVHQDVTWFTALEKSHEEKQEDNIISILFSCVLLYCFSL